MGKIRTQVHVFNCTVEAEFEAEILSDGSLKLTYHEPLIIPRSAFRLLTMKKDWR